MPTTTKSRPVPPATPPRATAGANHTRVGTQVYARPLGEWADDGICRNLPRRPRDGAEGPGYSTRERSAIFFDTFDDGKPRHAVAARAHCEACPVQAACLAHSILTLQDWGIWGGAVPDQRKRLRRFLLTHNLRASTELMVTLVREWLPLSKEEQEASYGRRRAAR